MLPKKQNKSQKIISLISFIVLVAFSVLMIVFRQRIIDQITVWNYFPQSEVSNLVMSVDFSDEGQFLFYASQPMVNEAQEFNQYCSKIENTSSILGCYKDKKIYIFNVKDERLDGIREVTVAHEMLHAVYDRLSLVKKAELEPLLDQEYQKLKNDNSFMELINFYEKTEPGELYNELHSIIGTTILNINSELEEYYGHYFDDRQKIVSYNTSYTGVFKNLSDQADALSEILEDLAAKIPVDSENYNSTVLKLNIDIEAFNLRAENSQFSSWAQFNYEKSLLENRVSAVEEMRQSISSEIDRYNSILHEYNSIALESQSLYNAIDSTLVEADSI